MNGACRSFRHLLEAALAGRPDPRRLARLGWHEHLLACEPCRALLDQEEALELLLASLPEPRLPPDVTARVLARLRARREGELERLLDLDQVDLPSGLAARVLARVREDGVPAGPPQAAGAPARPRGPGDRRDEARLDALLDAAGRVEPPEGLAERVLAGLAARGALRAPRALVAAGERGVPRRHLTAAAALVIVGGLAAYRTLGARGDGPVDRHVADLSDERVIQFLPVLESWEALAELDPLELAIVGQLDLADEAFLEQEGAR